MTLHRYVRDADPDWHAYGVWHEMDGDAGRALCDLDLSPMPYGRDPDQSPLLFQQSRGTGFPVGSICTDCQTRAVWRDDQETFPFHETAQAE